MQHDAVYFGAVFFIIKKMGEAAISSMQLVQSSIISADPDIAAPVFIDRYNIITKQSCLSIR